MKQTEIGLMPDDWEVAELEKVALVNMGQSPSSSTYNVTKSGLPFYQGKTDFGFIHPVKRIYCSSPSKIAEANDILISVRAPVGPVNITDEKCCIGRGVAAIRPKSITDRMFLYFYLMYSEAKIASKGTGSIFKAINKSQLISFPVPTFDKEEQNNIGNVLTLIQSAIQKQEQIIRTATELKNALMQKFFTEGTKAEAQKQTEIGLIPESWEVVELKSVCEKPTYGFTESASDKGNVKFLRITDIKDDGVNWHEVPFCNCPQERVNNYLLKDNDIVFARIGATTGKSFLIKNPPYAVYASYLIRVRPKSSEIIPDYLYYFFNSSEYWKQIDLNKKDNMKQGMNGSKLQILLIPKASIGEQNEIVNVFDSLDKKIKHHQTKKQTLSALFRSMLHQLMTGQIRVKDLELKKV